ncbi:MSCRAMM family protein [Romboutsia lituseburensis]|uniref:MSCRAMM family protein n=1 Tax=Romboutsia lituseburensis TaxID=1537 RepID=UPI00215AB139|nr:prealbumin-like fold domain-containing protein [Romboutsia lituseburensis]MCR8747009.1 prealbumin-like fold domain-containing protein [Romboutsia lituseburensis]
MTKVLQGAEFAIFDKNKKEIARSKTDENGKAIFNNINYGSYYYREIKAPIGYAIDSNFYDFKIENNEEILTKTVSNKIQEKYPSGGSGSNSSSRETNISQR